MHVVPGSLDMPWTEDDLMAFFSNRLLGLYSTLLSRCKSAEWYALDANHKECAQDLYQLFGWLFWMADSREGTGRTLAPRALTSEFSQIFEEAEKAVLAGATHNNAVAKTSIICALAGWSRISRRNATDSRSYNQNLADNLESSMSEEPVLPGRLAQPFAKLIMAYSDHVINHNDAPADEVQNQEMIRYSKLILDCFEIPSMAGQRQMWREKLESMERHASPASSRLWFRPLIDSLDKFEGRSISQPAVDRCASPPAARSSFESSNAFPGHKNDKGRGSSTSVEVEQVRPAQARAPKRRRTHAGLTGGSTQLQSNTVLSLGDPESNVSFTEPERHIPLRSASGCN